MQFYQKTSTVVSQESVVHTAPETAKFILQEHLQAESAIISAPELHKLVESTAHYLFTQRLDTRGRINTSRSSLVIVLAQLFFTLDDTRPSIAQEVAITLAATAFRTSAYIGFGCPPQDGDSRLQRARSVRGRYQGAVLTKQSLDNLFAFGFTALLPYLYFGSSDTHTAKLLKDFAEMVAKIRSTPQPNHPMRIYTLPDTFSFEEHVTLTACRCLLRTRLQVDQPNLVFSLSFLFPVISTSQADTRLHLAALIALCLAETDEMKNVCLNIVTTQPIPTRISQLSTLFDEMNLLKVLCQCLPVETWHPRGKNSYNQSVASLSFELLVAGIMMLQDGPLETRQAILRPLLDCHSRFTTLSPSIPGRGLPNMVDLLSHLSVSTSMTPRDSVLETMQFVVDFCHVDPHLHRFPGAEQDQVQDPQNWHILLQEIKASRISCSSTSPTVVKNVMRDPIVDVGVAAGVATNEEGAKDRDVVQL
ncbi:hypothetical protein FRC12_016214 [Ceratobasidium sp. 428]|nr:hypothetical protein FRC12_016214 [Ceratobasidium sp. 428]